MSFTSSACCAVIISQQQEQNIYHQKQCANIPAKSDKSADSKNCTVVENGRVVVKTVQTPSTEAS